jgi:hypothetical protein
VQYGLLLQTPGERKKMRWKDFGSVKKDKQLDERKLCPFLINLKSKYVHLCKGFTKK